jgi:hypothetical protein
MTKLVSQLLIGLFGDAAIGGMGIGLPVNTASAGLTAMADAYLEARRSIARETLIREFQSGERARLRDAEEVDEFMGILFRYQRAAEEGTSRRKLELIARLLAGQVREGRANADEFSIYCTMLQSLSEKELNFLVCLWQLDQKTGGKVDNSGDRRKALADVLIPTVFATMDELHACGSGLLRTGLVIALTGFLSDSRGTFATTPLMDELVRLARLDEASAHAKPSA